MIIRPTGIRLHSPHHRVRDLPGAASPRFIGRYRFQMLLAMVSILVIFPPFIRDRIDLLNSVTCVNGTDSADVYGTPLPTANTPQPSCVVWKANLETGDFSEFIADDGFLPQDSGEAVTSVSTDHAHSGTHAVKQVIDTSGDVQQGARLFRNHEVRKSGAYYSAWLFIDEPVNAPEWWNVWQWKDNEARTSADDSNVAASLNIRTKVEDRSLLEFYVHDRGVSSHLVNNANRSLRIGQWLHVETWFAADPTQGQVYVWVDGIQWFGLDNLNTLTADSYEIAWSVNNYSDDVAPAAGPGPVTIYWDDLAIRWPISAIETRERITHELPATDDSAHLEPAVSKGGGIARWPPISLVEGPRKTQSPLTGNHRTRTFLDCWEGSATPCSDSADATVGRRHRFASATKRSFPRFDAGPSGRILGGTSLAYG